MILEKRKNERVSLKMIADILGTSECTVSKALHNKPKVSSAMRQQVLALAKSLNYRPNIIARSMGRDSLKVAVISPEVWSSYYENIICGVFERAQELQDYRIEVTALHYKDFSDCIGCIAALEQADAENNDAVILMTGTFLPDDRKTLSDRLKIQNSAVLLLGGGMVPDVPVLCHIRQNSFLCGQIAGNLATLLWQGGGSAGVIIGRKDIEDHKMKSAGFVHILETAGIPFAGIGESFDEDGGAYQAAAELFAQNPELYLLYIGTENIAGVLAFLEKNQLVGKVKIIATGESAPVRTALESGVVCFTLDENLNQQGRIAMDKLFQKFLQLQTIDKQIKINPIIKDKCAVLYR